MSTTTMAVDVVKDVSAAGEKEKPSRKFPLPCWTQGETLALIDSYRKRWYALRRGYLRTADWDAVAESVVSRFPGVLPAKTSAQCRHKMEKLRQRYRAEKQRSLSFSTGKFFSSWFFFENMDAMENGSEVVSGQDLGNSGIGIKPDSFLDQNTLKLKLNNNMNSPNIVNGRKRPNFESKADSDKEEVDEPGFLKNPVIGLFAPRVSEGKKYVRTSNVGFNSVSGNEFHMLKSSENDSLLPPRFKTKRIEREDDEIDYRYMNSIGGGRYVRHIDPEKDTNMNTSMNMNMNTNMNMNGYSKMFGVGIEKKGNNWNTKREKYNNNNHMEEIVSAIKMLGEGFVKMEKMKMEMAMEIEKNRMEMEMKRQELVLQSQRQIMEAFTRGLVEMNKKIKTEVVLPEPKL